jgi:hypothetical protein
VWSELIVSFIWEGSEAETPNVPINPFEFLTLKEDNKIIAINIVRNLIEFFMMCLF